MEVDFSGDYLNAQNTQPDDIITITGEGKLETRKISNEDKLMLDLPVECCGKPKTYSPFDKEGQILVDAFGSDTKNWVGKQFKVIHVNYQGFGGVVKQKIVPEPIVN